MEAMIWTYSEHQDASIAAAGAYRCRVYRERSGTWTAIVIYREAATEQAGFPSAERAMAWCEDYVRQASA